MVLPAAACSYHQNETCRKMADENPVSFSLAFAGNGFDCIWIKSSDENVFYFLLLRLELACELFQVDSFPKENCVCF